MGLNGNGPGMEQVWNGNGTEQEWNGNGTGMEQKWNKSSIDGQWKLNLGLPARLQLRNRTGTMN